MEKKNTINKILNYGVACVWIINGAYCKVLNFVPRHKMIVAKILGDEYAGPMTLAIGISELCMAVWILSNYKSRWCAITQIIVVAIMNVIEFFLAPDLLLFGKLNAVFAFMFIILVYCNEFVLSKKLN